MQGRRRKAGVQAPADTPVAMPVPAVYQGARRPTSIRMPFPPRRIVCLTEETVETLYLLGEEDRIVGVTGYAVRPPRVRREKPRVGAFTSADLPKIIGLEPDLVLTFSTSRRTSPPPDPRRHRRPCLQPARRRRHPRHDPHLGALVGNPDKADALATLLEGRLQAVAAAAQGLKRPKVYVEEWDEPMISGIGWVSELVTIAGARTSLRTLPARNRPATASLRPSRSWPRLPTSSSPPGAARRCGRRPSCHGRAGTRSPPCGRPHRRDQVAADPPAGPRRAHRRARRHRRGSGGGARLSRRASAFLRARTSACEAL